jgi:hypothetical protein
MGSSPDRQEPAETKYEARHRHQLYEAAATAEKGV